MKSDEFLRTNVQPIFAGADVIGREVGSKMATPVGSQDSGMAAYNVREHRAALRQPPCSSTHW